MIRRRVRIRVVGVVVGNERGSIAEIVDVGSEEVLASSGRKRDAVVGGWSGADRARAEAVAIAEALRLEVV